MARLPDAELARRINWALGLLKKIASRPGVGAALVRRYGVSRRQADRYVVAAQKLKRELPIPGRKVVFTVKLPEGLVRRLRRLARFAGEPLSAIVTRALESFLKRARYG